MSRKSATDFIKKLNPQNKSGTIPQALDLIRSLRDSKGNLPIAQAVGAQNLAGMLQYVANKFNAPEPEHLSLLDQIIAILRTLRINNLTTDYIVTIGLEVLGFYTLNKSLEGLFEEVLLIKNVIVDDTRILRLMPEAIEKTNFSIHEIERIRGILNAGE